MYSSDSIYKKMEKGSSQDKILKYLIEVEKQGQDILADRNESIELDKRRNNDREAIRELKKSGEKYCYMTVGEALVKITVEKALSLLEEDQKLVSVKVNQIRSDLKVKVNELRDLEMLPPVPGFSLVPLSDKEREAMSQII